MTDTDLLIKRGVAIIIDSIILTTALTALFIVSLILIRASSAVWILIYALVSIVLFYSYFVLLEGRKGRGQTIGKRIMGIKVISLDGKVPTYTQTTIRTVLRIIDGLFLYLVGTVVVIISEADQRLGDIAAKTIVVKA